MSRYAPTPLKPGQRFRHEPGGPVCTVVRVNQCAAYVTGGITREETAVDPRTKQPRTQLVTDSGITAISPMSMVYPE